MNTPSIKEEISFLLGDMHPELSKIKGRVFRYRLESWIDYPGNLKMSQMENTMIVRGFHNDMRLYKLPEVKWGNSNNRLGARTAPGEVER
jgi:hypothetical protein